MVCILMILSKYENTPKFSYGILDCEPSNIWLLIRHGTRLPTANGIQRLSKMEKVNIINCAYQISAALKRITVFSSSVMKLLQTQPN